MDTCTVLVLRMTNRKWKEIKQQPIMLPVPAVPGSCLVSFHFLWAILSTSTVDPAGWVCLQESDKADPASDWLRDRLSDGKYLKIAILSFSTGKIVAVLLFYSSFYTAPSDTYHSIGLYPDGRLRA